MVGLYLGAIPLSAPASAQLGKVLVNLSLYDVARVEVLRGPQGTLYGASSMGGTVRIVPKAPVLGRFGVSGEIITSDTASGGGLNHSVNGMVNLPLGGKFALRLDGSITRDSGWIERRVIADNAVAVDSGIFPKVSRPSNFYSSPLQAQFNGVNTTSVNATRLQFLLKPTRRLSVLALMDYQMTSQGGPNAVDVNGQTTHPVMPSLEAHWEIYDTPEPQRDRFGLGSLEVIYHLPDLRISSATGYWARSTTVSQDATEESAAALGALFPTYDAPAGIGATGPSPLGPGASERDDTRQLSEEFRVTSTSTGPWQWLAGWFYQDLHSHWQLSVLAPQAQSALGGTNIYVDNQPQNILQNAEFGELSWRMSPHLTATASVRHYRYSLDQSNSEYGLFTVYGAQGNGIPYNTRAASSAAGIVPEFDLKYRFDPQLMVYATVSQGFRLGGVNQPIPVAQSTNGNPVLVANECGLQEKLLGVAPGACNPNVLLKAPSSFRSDSVWSYEMGEKSTLLKRRLTLDVSAYYERWINPQLATNLAGFGITANGANARIEGLEAELHVLLGRDWHFEANTGYTRATFSHASAIIGYPAGTAVPDTPTLMGSADLRWRHDLTADLAAFGSINWSYIGSRTDAPYGETITLWNIGEYLVHLPAYNLFNLRFGVESGRWRVALFVNNMMNARVLLDPQPQINLQTAAFTRYTVNRPRTVGLDLTWRVE
jgi:outer membrane receptor protein involved in Fe transport